MAGAIAGAAMPLLSMAAAVPLAERAKDEPFGRLTFLSEARTAPPPATTSAPNTSKNVTARIRARALPNWGAALFTDSLPLRRDLIVSGIAACLLGAKECRYKLRTPCEWRFLI